MFNGGGEIPVPIQPPAPKASHQSKMQASVVITEQPASKALRFRYECEGRSAGSIPGASSTPENKTFPTIQIVGYQGRAVVVVSCVTKDTPYRPHPHNLVGREGCKTGVCTLEIPTDTMTVHFSNLGIQCVKKKDIEQALRVREEIRVDPFRTGFSHRNQPTSIDLNAVRLCFQVFLEGDTPGKFSVPLKPVVSVPIYDKKAMSDLSIIKLSDCVSYVDGGRKDIILLCEKVAKEDIQVRFFEENGEWEEYADIQPSQVHKQHAIWFKTPRYRTLEVTEPVKVFIQLRRPSDGATSEPLPFELLPLDSEPKRKKILRHLKEQRSDIAFIKAPIDGIKSEPRDTTPSPYQGGLSPYGGGISPGYVPNAGLSPQYMPVGPTSPAEIYQYMSPSHIPNILENAQNQMWNTMGPATISNNLDKLGSTSQSPMWNLPATTTLGNTLPQTTSQSSMWNIPSTSTTVGNALPQTENLLYDLDTRELNSDKIAETLNTLDSTALPEIQNLSLSFSDVNPGQDQNMTDSLTKLANNAIDNM